MMRLDQIGSRMLELIRAGDYDSAAGAARELIRATGEELGAESFEYVMAHGNLARIEHLRGRVDKAEVLYRDVLQHLVDFPSAPSWVVGGAIERWGECRLELAPDQRSESLADSLMDSLTLLTVATGPDGITTLTYIAAALYQVDTPGPAQQLLFSAADAMRKLDAMGALDSASDTAREVARLQVMEIVGRFLLKLAGDALGDDEEQPRDNRAQEQAFGLAVPMLEDAVRLLEPASSQREALLSAVNRLRLCHQATGALEAAASWGN